MEKLVKQHLFNKHSNEQDEQAVLDIQEHESVAVGSARSFGIVFCIVFAVIGLWPLIQGEALRMWSIGIAAAFLIIALVWPGLLQPLNKLWFKLGALLGRIVSPVVMGLIYFLTVVPTGFVFRLRRVDLLHLKKDAGKSSYWVSRDDTVTGSMRDQF